MTLAQTTKAIREEIEKNGTDIQKAKLSAMGIAQLDSMIHIAQSMGVKSAISMHL